MSAFRKFITKTISTFFYLGYLPLMPGTFASAVGVFLFYLLKGSIFGYVSFTLFLLFAGFLVSGSAESIFHKKDAKYIVIDEIVGVLVAFFSLLFRPWDIGVLVIAFILFRVLDILKPYPSNKLQQLKGSLGIMSDDIVVGLYTNIILQLLFRLASFKTS